MAPLHPASEHRLRIGIARLAEGGERLGLRVEGHEHLLFDLLGLVVACSVDDGEMAPAAADVGHGGMLTEKPTLCKI